MEYDELGLLKEPEPPASLEDLLASDDGGILEEEAEDIFEIRNVPAKPIAVTVPERTG